MAPVIRAAVGGQSSGGVSGPGFACKEGSARGGAGAEGRGRTGCLVKFLRTGQVPDNLLPLCF